MMEVMTDSGASVPAAAAVGRALHVATSVIICSI